MSERFYSEIPIVQSFAEAVREGSYRRLPNDWHVLVADITQSTKALDWGMYKHVNILGAACIMSVLNICGDIEIPFVYGGDGAIMCVPASLLSKAEDALLATKLTALKNFKLQLRAGSVSVADLERAGKDVLVSRWRVSPDCVQAVFAGSGIDAAEEMIKEKAERARIVELGGDYIPQADFSGLECRWQDIRPRIGEIVCLIVKSLRTDVATAAAMYQEVLSKVAEIYGDESSSNPLSLRNLHLSFDPRSLMGETLVRSEAPSWRSRIAYLAKLQLLVAFGWVSMRFGLVVRGIEWGKYKEVLIRNTDNRRFVGSYRQVLAGTPDQRAKLSEYLESRFRAGDLVYGIHVSDRALMTCLVFDYIGRHLHFLDGADGGFTLAAKDMKSRYKLATS